MAMRREKADPCHACVSLTASRRRSEFGIRREIDAAFAFAFGCGSQRWADVWRLLHLPDEDSQAEWEDLVAPAPRAIRIRATRVAVRRMWVRSSCGPSRFVFAWS